MKICDAIRFCNKCGRVIKAKANHECGVSRCKVCRVSKPENHTCYMQPLRNNNIHFSDGASPTPSSSSSTTIAASTSVSRISTELTKNALESKHVYARQKGRVAFVFYDF